MLGEQAGFGLGEDAEADQALELVPGALDVLRHEGEVEALAQVAGAVRVRLAGRVEWVMDDSRGGGRLSVGLGGAVDLPNGPSD